MKIKKPEDVKYFKDIVLNDILEEISNETGAPIIKSKKRKNHQNKSFLKTILFIIATLIFLFLLIALFNLLTNTDTEVKPINHPSKTEIFNTQEWKMKEDIITNKQSTVPKVVKEKPIIDKNTHKKMIKIKTVKPQPLPKKKTEREIAKEALRQQMLN